MASQLPPGGVALSRSRWVAQDPQPQGLHDLPFRHHAGVNWIPLTCQLQQGLIVHGEHLHFRPTRWDRWCQQLESCVGELLPDQPLPLPKKRLDIGREQALKLWSEKAKEGWRTTAPQWQPPPIPNAERRSTLG